MAIISLVILLALWLPCGYLGYKLYCRKMSVEGCEPYEEPENRSRAILSGPATLIWLYWPF